VNDDRSAGHAPIHSKGSAKSSHSLLLALSSQNLLGSRANQAIAPMVTTVKAVKTVMPRPAKHWVGNGFNVYPVFAHMAFTKALSPWLMFDYAAPQQVSAAC